MSERTEKDFFGGAHLLPENFEALVGSLEGAEGILEALGRALFPSEPDASQVTWEEKKGPEKQVEADPAARAIADLRAAEVRFRTLVEQIPAVTFMAVLGEGKNEIYISPHIERMLGYKQAEWLADPFLWYWRLHPEDRVVWNEEFARGCQTGGPFRAECRFLARDESIVWVHGEARLVKDDLGRPAFLQGVAFDITEAKRAQAMLLSHAVEKARVEEELEIARRVQTSILPRHLDVAGMDVAAVMKTADDVGGDYYEVLPVADGAWFGIGDVSGHGLNAGLVMLMLQSAVAAVIRTRPDILPSEVLHHINELLFENIRVRLGSDDYITCSILRYFAGGRIIYAGAHLDVLVHRARYGKVERLEQSGVWLGARRGIDDATADREMQLEVGDVMVLYTDGITEAQNAQRELFGLERVEEILVRAGDSSAAEIRDRILRAVEKWSSIQGDDRTILVARYQGAGG